MHVAIHGCHVEKFGEYDLLPRLDIQRIYFFVSLTAEPITVQSAVYVYSHHPGSIDVQIDCCNPCLKSNLKGSGHLDNLHSRKWPTVCDNF